jgi:hypothetical protein
MGIQPATVRHAEEGTRGAGNTRFSERTFNGLLSAVVALLGNLEERSSEEAEQGKGMNETYHREVAYQPQHVMVINVKRCIRDAGKLSMSMRIDGDDKWLVRRRNHGEYKALGGRAS